MSYDAANEWLEWIEKLNWIENDDAIEALLRDLTLDSSTAKGRRQQTPLTPSFLVGLVRRLVRSRLPWRPFRMAEPHTGE